MDPLTSSNPEHAPSADAAPRGRPARGRGRGGRGRGRARGRGRGRARAGGGGGVRIPGDIQEAVPATNGLSAVDVPPGLPASPADVAPVQHRSRTTETTLSDMTHARFDALPILDPLKRALTTVFRYETMTAVQDRAIAPALDGADALVKARTGTGKTLAFLIPSVQRVLAAAAAPTVPASVSILVMSPTRELALQIVDEAVSLSTFVPPLRAQCVVGGTNLRKDVSTFAAKPPVLLVATPGRLLDLLGNERSGFRAALQNLSVLVLDEADRLLDMGFADEINRIFEQIPPPAARQTLLFSATLPDDVRAIARRALRPEYSLVDCVGDADNTHAHVPQSVLVASLADQIPTLGALLVQCVRVERYKIVVFFPTARMVQFASELFAQMGQKVLEMHSRRTQGHRTRVSEQFRVGSSLILFTSDVSARGMDYPGVTTVIQVGLPADRAQYVHRVGRTGRAGNSGSAVLVLADFEAQGFLAQVKDLPIERSPPLEDDIMSAMRQATRDAALRVRRETIDSAYQAWLGFYNSNLRLLRWTKHDVVNWAACWAREVGALDETPELLAQTVSKMHLRDVPGIRIAAGGGRRGRGGGGRGRRGGGGGGGMAGGYGAMDANGEAPGYGAGGRGRGRGRSGRGGRGRGGGGGGGGFQNGAAGVSSYP